jgi:hypothetical protein
VERDLASLEEQIFIIQLETSPGGLSCPDLHSQQVSYHLEAPSSEAELLGLCSHPGGRTAEGGLASWRSRSSVFSWRLHQGVCLAPIYISSKLHSIWRLLARRPNYWVSAVFQEGAVQFGVSVIGGADLYLSV